MASVQPYQFEPLSDPESETEGVDGPNIVSDTPRRLGQDVSEW